MVGVSLSRTSRRTYGLHTTAFIFALAAACVVVFLTARGASGQADEGAVDTDPAGIPYASGELIVSYEEGVSPEEVVESVGGTIEKELPSVDAQVLEFPEVRQESSGEGRESVLEDIRRELEEEPAVESVGYNYLRETAAISNDRLSGFQWNMGRIAAPTAWRAESGDPATKIAIIDSGADVDHPDLESKIIGTCDAAGTGGSGSCPGGADVTDRSSHGTHVAGIAAAATNNRFGIAGTCPECSMLIAKVARSNGDIFVSDIISGIEWAVAEDADVINMSLGGEGDNDAEEDAVNDAAAAGVVLVSSAGNANSITRSFPAAYPAVISVSATTRGDGRARYSNYGGWIDVSAPGGNALRSDQVLSTLPGPRYGYKSGTSMSSPVVAGVAGLLASQGRGAAEIRQRIEATALDLGPAGKDIAFGHGRVDAAAAVGARPRNTPPRIVAVAPRNGASIRRDRVRIVAIVRDRETNLTRSHLTLVVDGRRVAFQYDAARGHLSTTIQARPGVHRAHVLVRDGWGASDSRTWSFSTPRR